METKLNQLRTMLAGLAPEGVCAAFSGGTDSSLLLTVLSELRMQTPFPLLAVIFTTAFQTAEETVSAQSLAEELGVPVENGVFRTHMMVHLTNDGPVTILLDSKKQF